MKTDKPYIIALAGPSGSGKTELLKILVSAIAGADSLRFDDYDHLHQWPSDNADWARKGADPSQFKSTELFRDPKELKRGGQIENPFTRRTVGPAKVFVVETFFGREHPELAPLVDFVVCMNVPLEICMARRISRDIKGISDATLQRKNVLDHKCIVDHVQEYCSRYLDYTRELYLHTATNAAANCDFELTGIMSPEECFSEVRKAIGERVEWRET